MDSTARADASSKNRCLHSIITRSKISDYWAAAVQPAELSDTISTVLLYCTVYCTNKYSINCTTVLYTTEQGTVIGQCLQSLEICYKTVHCLPAEISESLQKCQIKE